MDEFVHPTFQKELLGIAGFHDGERVFISGEYDSVYVSSHELVHDRIFKSLLDGQILGIFSLLRKKDKFSAVKSKVEDIERFLWENSLLAHERSATYLGVQSLTSSADRARVVCRLNAEYNGYFNFFASIIDVILSSSYLRYAVAWAVTRWAFSSPRAQIEALNWLNLNDYIAVAGPNERMNAWRQLSSESCRAWVTESLDQVGRRWNVNCVDLDQDQFWETLRSDQARNIDTDICNELFSNLLIIMNMPTCLSDFANTELYAAALTAGVNFKEIPNTYLPQSDTDLALDSDFQRGFFNAMQGDSFKVFGNDFIDGEYLSLKVLSEDLLSYVGYQTHATIVVRSSAEAWLFVSHLTGEGIICSKNNYRMCADNVHAVLLIMKNFFCECGFFYPVIMAFDAKFYFETEHSVICSYLIEEMQIVKILEDYSDETLEEFSVSFYIFIDSYFSRFIEKQVGILEFGNVTLMDPGGKFEAIFTCSIFYPTEDDALNVIGIHPRASLVYRKEFIRQLELMGSISVKYLVNQSVAREQMILSVWSVFASK